MLILQAQRALQPQSVSALDVALRPTKFHQQAEMRALREMLNALATAGRAARIKARPAIRGVIALRMCGFRTGSRTANRRREATLPGRRVEVQVAGRHLA